MQRGAGFSLIERGKRGVRVRVGHGVSATNHLLESEREHASRVRGAAKVFCHLMFGVLALTVDQLMRLLT